MSIKKVFNASITFNNITAFILLRRAVFEVSSGRRIVIRAANFRPVDCAVAFVTLGRKCSVIV